MTEKDSQKFAEKSFKKLPDYLYQWNILHAKSMIKAIEELSKTEQINLDKLKALAWVHDVGKIISDENHAELSIEILEKEFELDEIDRDCIRNHGSSGTPISLESKIFQNADGLSLFYPETLLYRFWAEGKEGANFEQIKEKLTNQFSKYLKAYSNNQIAVDLLKQKYFFFFQES